MIPCSLHNAIPAESIPFFTNLLRISPSPEEVSAIELYTMNTGKIICGGFWMEEAPRMVTVTAENVDEEGFFCYKSKPKSEGYRVKKRWLRDRFAEGLTLRMIYEGQRSVAFIEYIPGEYAWRAVEASSYMFVHCLWVVGSGKGKGYANWLLDTCEEDARARGKAGVVALTSDGTWLCGKEIFLKRGYVIAADPVLPFTLVVKRSMGTSRFPSMPNDWASRAARYPEGATILHADQCPYMPDAVQGAVNIFKERGINTRVIKLDTLEELRVLSPTPYGVFGIVLDGKVFSYTYMGNKEIKALDSYLASK